MPFLRFYHFCLFSLSQFSVGLKEHLMAKTLYVGNFSYSTTEAELRTLFAQVGEVDSVSLITDRETGRSKGFGFIEMNTEAGAREAITRFNGYTLADRTLTVNE